MNYKESIAQALYAHQYRDLYYFPKEGSSFHLVVAAYTTIEAVYDEETQLGTISKENRFEASFKVHIPGNDLIPLGAKVWTQSKFGPLLLIFNWKFYREIMHPHDINVIKMLVKKHYDVHREYLKRR